MSELQEKRAAEEGYRTIGRGEAKKREWFSLAEKDAPATKWLKEFDPPPKLPPQTCPGRNCGKVFVPKQATSPWCSAKCKQRWTFSQRAPKVCALPGCAKVFVPRLVTARLCSKRCRRRWVDLNMTPGQIAHKRKRHAAYLPKWIAKNRASVDKTNTKIRARKKASRRAKAAQTIYNCMDCLDQFTLGHNRVVNPPPTRCVPCVSEWNIYRRRVYKRRQAVAQKLKLCRAPQVFKVGDLVTWTSRFSRPCATSRRKSGKVVVVIHAGVIRKAAIEAAGLRANVEDFKFGYANQRDRETYVVSVGKDFYLPHVEDLQLIPSDGPVEVTPIHAEEQQPRERPLNSAGTVRLRKRMAA